MIPKVIAYDERFRLVLTHAPTLDARRNKLLELTLEQKETDSMNQPYWCHLESWRLDKTLGSKLVEVALTLLVEKLGAVNG